MKSNTIHGQGNHIYIDARSESGELGNPEYIEQYMLDILELTNFRLVEGPDTIVKDGEVSSQLVLDSSSMNVHTVPSTKKISIDLFSCNEFDYEAVLQLTHQRFSLTHHQSTLLSRGITETIQLKPRPQYGNHVAIDAQSQSEAMHSIQIAEQMFTMLAEILGLENIAVRSIDYRPTDRPAEEHGVTSVVLFRSKEGLHRGHFSLHTYPHEKRQYIGVDCYCDKRFDSNKVISMVKKTYDTKTLNCRVHLRELR